jgi:2-(1,2-epoxy-1,2-dihydrophenyl)acetyl-CoA isomerase
VASVSVSSSAGIARVTMDRPGSLNAWTPDSGRELLAALEGAATDSEVRCVVISGAGRAFSAGADVKAPRDLLPGGEPDLETRLREIYNPVILAVREMPKPVIAAVGGPAAGIGCSLALACDFILAARSAYFLLAFVHLGLIPDGAASYMSAMRMGYTRALEMAMLGQKVGADEAAAHGLINAVHEDGALAGEVDALAAKLAAGPTVAYGNIKRALDAGALAGLRAQLELEPGLQQKHAGTADFQEGVDAFREKRQAEFRGA